MINQDRLVQTFTDLVKIDSESGNESTISVSLINKLLNIGFNLKTDQKGNIIAHLDATPDQPTVLLSAHMDTVKPGINIQPDIQDGIIRSKTDTILGADDKSGIAEIIEAITVIIENKLSHPNLLVVFTVEEEVGLKGARALAPLKADFGFILDTSGAIGKVVFSAPTHDTFNCTIRGKAAHAGIEPEKGINAIVAASKAISKLKLGKIDDETVANVGIISGGIAMNIVPEEVTFKGEVRSLNESKVDKHIETMKATIQEECINMGANYTFTPDREYHAYTLPKESKPVHYATLAATALGLPLNISTTKGGSDANHFNSLNIPSVVLSTGMTDVHSTNESIHISDMILATEFLIKILESI